MLQKPPVIFRLMPKIIFIAEKIVRKFSAYIDASSCENKHNKIEALADVISNLHRAGEVTKSVVDNM
jgi:methylaspartate ammonia-lyase